MRKNKGKIISILLIALSVISIGITTYAHSGKTDSSGGHKDNKNKSRLGSYHYHCGGHPAHLHTNGVCPYSSNSSKKSTKTTSSSSKGTTTSSPSSTKAKSTTSKDTTTTPSTVDVTNIQINEKVESIDVGDNRTLTATITPDNATNKNITWKSSDDSIATVSSTGKITAKKVGIAEITATSSNGKVSTIKISVKEEMKEEKEPVKDITVVSTATTGKSNITNNTTIDTQEDSNVIGGVVAVGILGGAGYWGYKKRKK